MILFHQSPFDFYPSSTLSWTPYIIAPSSYSQRRCGNKKQKLCAGTATEKPSEQDSKVIYEDRNTRIQHIDDNKVEFSMDLPGVKASNTKVEIHNGILKVEAERKHGNDRTIKIERSFSVKDIVEVESDDIHASLADGVLHIIIPKKVEAESAEETTSSPIPIGAENPSDISDNSAEVRYSVDLPGVLLSDVKLDLKNDTISLLATRKLFGKDSTTKRNFTVDTNKVDTASFKGYLVDGVLTIIGSKKVQPGPKQITVTDGSTLVAPMSIENEIESKDEGDMVIVETVTEEGKKA
jgi:HSP20 family molecular chaperone IbpA